MAAGMTIEEFFGSRRTAAAALNVVIAMVLILVVLVGYRATHHVDRSVQVHPCAMVLTRESGPECR
jgi:purine-cytosine permease-like protein